MTFCLRKNIEFKIKYITFEISNRWLYLIKTYKLIKFSNTVIRQIFKGLIIQVNRQYIRKTKWREIWFHYRRYWRSTFTSSKYVNALTSQNKRNDLTHSCISHLLDLFSDILFKNKNKNKKPYDWALECSHWCTRYFFYFKHHMSFKKWILDCSSYFPGVLGRPVQ